RPELTEPLVHRLEHALVDRVERSARRRELAQYELHEVARLRPGDNELHHAPHAFEDARLCLMLRQGGRIVEPDGGARHAAYGIDDMLAAGRAQALLAAEVIGDRTDVGLRFRRALGGPGGLEAFLSELLRAGHYEGDPGCLGICGAGFPFCLSLSHAAFNQSND